MHEVTAVALYIMQHMAYDKAMDGEDEPIDFNTWCDVQSKEHPQFCYCATTMKLELTVLQLVRSLREGNFSLYVDTVSKLIPWFFALDHVHYSRWLPVHVRDMRELPAKHPSVYAQFVDENCVARQDVEEVFCYSSRPGT